MVRQSVVALGNANLRIGSEVQLPTQHEGHDARDVGLKRQPLELVHQLDVLIESLRDPIRTLQGRQIGFGTP